MRDASAIGTAVEVDILAIPGISVSRLAGLDHHISDLVIYPKHAVASAEAAVAMGDFQGRFGQPDRNCAAMAGGCRVRHAVIP